MATDEIRHTIAIDANLTRIQTQLKTLEGNFGASFKRLEGAAASAGAGIASALGVSFSIGGIAAATKEILDFADTLQNLSQQTGLSVEALSGIKSVVEENGSSLDAFGRGVFNLQKNLGGIDEESDKVAVAIKTLGLNLDQLRNSSPDDFIRQITEALSKIDNPIQRTNLLFTLLGKSAKELGPVFQELTGRFDELRSKGLSADTVQLLDDVGDSFTRLKNSALTLGAEGAAGLLRFFGVFTETGKFIDSLIRVQEEIDQIDARLARRKSLRESGLGFFTAKDDTEQLNRRAALVKEQSDIDRQINARNAANAKPKAPFVPLPGKKQQNDAESFLAGLDKQLEGLKSKQLTELFGPQAGLGADLDAQFEAFKAKLAADKIPIPAGLDAQFQSIKEQILGANLALTQTQTEMEKIAALGKVLNQDSAEWLNVDEDLAKAREKTDQFAKQLDEIRQNLQLGAIDTRTPQGAEKRRVAEIELDFVKTAARITEIGNQAGVSQEQIAADVALAWQKALNEIGLEPDFAGLDREMAKINTQAAVFGNSFDAISAQIHATESAIQDLINKGIGALDPKMQELSGRLENLKGLDAMRESFENVFDSIGKGIESTLQGVLQGTQSFGDAMKNLARNVLLSITGELNKNFILKPLKEQFSKLLPQAPGANGLAGAAGQTQPSAALTTAGTSLSGSATALNQAAAALSAAANAQSGGIPALGGTPGGGLIPNIQNSPNVAAPQNLPIPDLSQGDWTIELVKEAEDGFSVVADSVSQGIQSVVNESQTGFGGLFSQLGSLISEGLSKLSSLGGGGESGGGLMSGIGSAVSTAMSFIGSFFEEGGSVRPGGGRRGLLPLAFASGGEVPAILHQGEYVLRKSAVDKIGLPMLEKMNMGEIKMPAFQFGGYVRSAALPRFETGGAIDSAVNEMARSSQAGRFEAGKSAPPKVDVQVMGDIIPRGSWTTKDDVIKIGIQQFNDRDGWMSMMEQRTSLKGGG